MKSQDDIENEIVIRVESLPQLLRATTSEAQDKRLAMLRLQSKESRKVGQGYPIVCHVLFLWLGRETKPIRRKFCGSFLHS